MISTKKWTDVIGPWEWEKIEGGMRRYKGDACSWSVYTKNPNLIIIVTIYNGFVTDGASTPKLFQCILDDWYGDERDRVAIGHDCMYAISGKAIGNHDISRAEADHILAGGAHKVIGKNRAQCRAIETAVQLFAGGSKHWGNMEPDNVNDDGTLKFKVECVQV